MTHPISAQEMLHRYVSPDSGAGAGVSVAGGADVDGDQIADWIVGEYQWVDANGDFVGRARVLSGADGSIIGEHTGTKNFGQLGRQVCMLGDVDGDQRAEYAISEDLADAGGNSRAGQVKFYRGSDGGEYFTINGQQDFEQLGEVLRPAGSFDRNGVPAVIIASVGWKDVNQNAVGQVKVVRGDGLTLATVQGSRANIRYGASCAAVADLNGDGFGEILVGAPFDSTLGNRGGYAELVSGSNGAFIKGWFGFANDQLGWSVTGLGDINQSGASDYAIGIPGRGPDGMVDVIDGGAHNTIHLLDGQDPNEGTPGAFFGHSMTSVGDVTGDGIEDLAIGANNGRRFNSTVGTLSLYSTDNGALHSRIYGRNNGDGLGQSVAMGGDMNGDGLGDVVVGDFLLGNGGGAYVWAGKELFLHCTHDSIAVGNSPRLRVGGGMLGSWAGLFLASLNGVPLPQLMLTGSFDGTGGQTWTETVPPSLQGFTVELFSISCAAGGRCRASNLVPIQFL